MEEKNNILFKQKNILFISASQLLRNSKYLFLCKIETKLVVVLGNGEYLKGKKAKQIIKKIYTTYCFSHVTVS